MPPKKSKHCLPNLRSFIDAEGLGIGSIIDDSKQLASSLGFDASPSTRTWQDAMRTGSGVSLKMAIRVQKLSKAVFQLKNLSVSTEILKILEIQEES